MAVYEGDREVCREVIRHDAKTLEQFLGIWDQFDFRMNAVRDWVSRSSKTPNAIAAIGGLLKPLEGGVYRVNGRMLADARANLQGGHASNLGCAMAFELEEQYKCPAFAVDPVSVDEFEPLARYSGHPLIPRRSLSHALNIHAAARRAAKELGVPLSDSSCVVAHLGGGISVAAVRYGRIIDVNDASSDGPFSPERSGGLPLQPFISLCFSGKYTEHEVRSLVMSKGGLLAYLNTNSAQDVEQRIAAGDSFTGEIYEAMAYQIAKEIAAMAAVLRGKVDAIVLTGGLAASRMLVGWIKERVEFIAQVLVYPGEDEMKALVEGALRVLRGEEEAKEY